MEGGEGKLGSIFFFVNHFVSVLETHAIYIYGWVFGVAQGNTWTREQAELLGSSVLHQR